MGERRCARFGGRWPSPDCALPPPLPGGSLRQAAGLVSDEVELYHRTYTTLLRSSGETLLRVLEPSHRSMNSSLHPLASTNDVDLGAFMYAMRRLPAGVWQAAVIVMGQEARVFERAGFGQIEEWEAVEAPARRRRWFDSHDGTMAVLLASTSDLDDLIPTLVAYQVEWNKLLALVRASDQPEDEEPDPGGLRRGLRRRGRRLDPHPRGVGRPADLPVRGPQPQAQPAHPHARRLAGRLRAHDAALVAPGALGDGGAGTRRPAGLLRLLQPALDGQPRHADGALGRGGGRALRRGARAVVSARGAPALPRGAGRGLVGELPLLRRAAAVGLAARGRRGVGRAPGGRDRHRRDAPLQPGRAARLLADHRARQARPRGARPAARPGRRRAARGVRRRGRQHRVSARAGRLQHPARGDLVDRRGARRLRARQGGDAERRRRRRADLRRHPRRALELDLLARQRVLVRRHRAVPALRLAGSTTSAR